MDQMVAKEISTLVENYLDDVLQYAYENSGTGVRSVVYKVAESSHLACSAGSNGRVFRKHIPNFSKPVPPMTISVKTTFQKGLYGSNRCGHTA